MRIAIIDDVKGIRETIEMALKSMKEVNNADIKIDCYDSYFDIKDKDCLTDCDLLILDEAMEMVNGSEILAHLFHANDCDYSKIPCTLFITGFFKGIMNDRLKKKGFDLDKLNYGIIEKPFKLEDFQSIVRESCPEMFRTLSGSLKTPSIFTCLVTGFVNIFGTKQLV